MSGHSHYRFKLFVFVYDIGQEFIGVGGEQIGDYSYELQYEPPYLFGDGEFDSLCRDLVEGYFNGPAHRIYLIGLVGCQRSVG